MLGGWLLPHLATAALDLRHPGGRLMTRRPAWGQLLQAANREQCMVVMGAAAPPSVVESRLMSDQSWPTLANFLVPSHATPALPCFTGVAEEAGLRCRFERGG